MNVLQHSINGALLGLVAMLSATAIAATSTSELTAAQLGFVAALNDAEQRLVTLPANTRLSFTRTETDPEGNRSRSRYTPASPSGGNWQILEAAESEDAALVQWDERLLLRLQNYNVDTALLIRETDTSWVFHIPNLVSIDIADNSTDAERQLQEHVSEQLPEVLQTELEIRRQQPQFLSLRVFIEEPFKPTVLATVDKFDVRYTFAEAWTGGPLVRHTQTRNVEGRFGFFLHFAEQATAIHSDFEQVLIAANPQL
jgi:hypothetical protein